MNPLGRSLKVACSTESAGRSGWSHSFCSVMRSLLECCCTHKTHSAQRWTRRVLCIALGRLYLIKPYCRHCVWTADWFCPSARVQVQPECVWTLRPRADGSGTRRPLGSKETGSFTWSLSLFYVYDTTSADLLYLYTLIPDNRDTLS